MPSTSQEYFKPENFIPIDLEKISPNIFLMRFSNSLEQGHCYCVYFWRRAALFSSFCRQMMGPSEMVFSDDAVGGCLTVYIFFGCLWCHMCYKLGRCFLSGSPFTNDAGVILNNFIIIGDNYIRTYLTALWKKISLNVNTIYWRVHGDLMCL